MSVDALQHELWAVNPVPATSVGWDPANCHAALRLSCPFLSLLKLHSFILLPPQPLFIVAPEHTRRRVPESDRAYHRYPLTLLKVVLRFLGFRLCRDRSLAVHIAGGACERHDVAQPEVSVLYVGPKPFPALQVEA